RFPSYRVFSEVFPEEYWLKGLFRPTPCAHCGKEDRFYLNRKRKCFTCSCGTTHIYPKQRTIFERSSVNLAKWYYLMMLFVLNEPLQARHVQKIIKVAFGTAMRMRQIIWHV